MLRRFSRCGLVGVLTLLAIAGCGKPASTSNAGSNSTQPAGEETANHHVAAPQSSDASAGFASEAGSADDAQNDITLEVVDIDGYRAALERHKGKVIFVDFWATWCPPCMENFPHTVHISRAFPKDKVAVMSVSFDEPEDKAKALEFLQKQEARFENFLTIYGAGTEGTEAFEIDSGVPHYKIYDREGKVAKTLAPGPDLEITLGLLDSEIRKELDR